MAKTKMMKCTGCSYHHDITDVEPGTTLDCPSCNSKTRIPTGNTGKFQKVQVGAKKETTSIKKKTGTGVIRKERMTGNMRKAWGADPTKGQKSLPDEPQQKTSNTPYVVMAIVGVVVLVGVIFLIATSGKKKGDTPNVSTSSNKGKSGDSASTANTTGGTSSTTNTGAAPKQQIEIDQTKRTVRSSGGQAGKIPDTFEKASDASITGTRLSYPEADKNDLRGFLSRNDIPSITEKWDKYLGPLLDLLVFEDDESTVKRGYDTLIQIARAQFGEQYSIGGKPLADYLEGEKTKLNAIQARAGVYATMLDIYKQTTNKGAGGNTPNTSGMSEDSVRLLIDRLCGESKFGIVGMENYPAVSVSPGSPADKDVMSHLKRGGRSVLPFMVKILDEVVSNADPEFGIDVEKAQVIVSAITIVSGIGKIELYPSKKNPGGAKDLPAKWREALGVK